MDWYSDNWQDVYRIPIEEISFNTAVLGNHPTVESIKIFLDSIGKDNYKNWRNYTEGRQPDGTWVRWEGHQVGQYLKWFESEESKIGYPVFKTFDDLFNYVDKNRMNIHPIRVMIEPDNEIFLMEGRHRYMSARILGMTELPAIVQVRKRLYGPETIRTLQRIR